MWVPDDTKVVERDLLLRLQNSAAKVSERVTSGGKSRNRIANSGSIDIDQWLDDHCPEARGPIKLANGQKWSLDPCPFSSDHTDGAYIIRYDDGGVVAGCFHKSCTGKDWDALRDLKELGWRKREAASREGTRGRGEEGSRNPSAATRLLEMVDDVQLFHTAEKEPFAAVRAGERRQTWPVHSRELRLHLSETFYREASRPISATSLDQVVDVLAAKALHGEDQAEVYLRVAGDLDRVDVDLVNGHSVVKIDRGSWSVIPATHAPHFRRPSGIHELPPPEPGSMDLLRPFLNVASDTDWRLIVAWLVAALRPNGPYPILVLQGEQGCAKSTTTKLLKLLIDPSKAPLRPFPKDVRDLSIQASNSWILAFDNLTRLTPAKSSPSCSTWIDHRHRSAAAMRVSAATFDPKEC